MTIVKGYSVDPGWRMMFQALDLDLDRVLRRAGLPENLFVNLPDILTPEEFYHFVEAIDQELGDRDLALAMYETFSVEMFSPPIFAAVCSPNLKVAATRVAEHKPLVGPVKLKLTEETDSFKIELIQPELPWPSPSFLTLETLFWVYIARRCTCDNIVPMRFQAPIKPNCIEQFEELLGTQFSLGDGYEVTFSTEDAEKPFLSQNDFTWAAFQPEIRRRLSELEHDASMRDQVQAVLLEALPAGLATMSHVANRLRMSERTLQRRLKDENMSFQNLLSETRAELSRYYLKKTSLPYAEVAYLLGYKETASFYRAFKDWEDATPEQFRFH